MKSKIIFFGDSIIRYKINNRFNDWSYELKKLIVANMDDRGNVNVRTYKTGKYGRWLVEIGENGTVNKAMAEKWPWHGP